MHMFVPIYANVLCQNWCLRIKAKVTNYKKVYFIQATIHCTK